MSETHGNATDPNEPKTPFWLTALGGVLFLVAGLAWALYTPDPPLNADGKPMAAAGADAGAAK